MEKNNLQPDGRNIIEYYYISGIDDPETAQKEVIDALEGFMDRDTLIGTAMPVLAKIGLPIPELPIIKATLQHHITTESEARAIIYVLQITNSMDNYKDVLENVYQRFPNLRG